MEDKFIVIKKEDVDKYLNYKGKLALNHCLEVIADSRNADGKKNNNYLVVNQDEKYAALVKKLILKEVSFLDSDVQISDKEIK